MQAIAELYVLIVWLLVYFAAAVIAAAPIAWLIRQTKWYDDHFGTSKSVSEYTRRKYTGK